MLAQRLFICFTCFLVSCVTNTVLSDALTAAIGRQQMAELLQNQGWPDLEPLELTGFDGRSYKVQDLLETDAQGRILVTAENMHVKVGRAHGFLNCDYAIMFLTYIEYMHAIRSACDTMTSSDKQVCLTKSGQLSRGNTLVSRMQSALGYFKSIRVSPSIELNDEISEILSNFSRAHETTLDPDGEQQTKSGKLLPAVFAFPSANDKATIVHLKTDGTIAALLNRLRTRTVEFFENHCGPREHLSKTSIASSTYSWAVVFAEKVRYGQTSPMDGVNKMYTAVNSIVNDFLVTDYTRLGFKFDAHSKAAVLNEITDTKNIVHQTNVILRHVGWSKYLGRFDIVLDNWQYSIDDLLATDLGQMANEANVDGKIRKVYVFMSCYFVELLKELLFYIKSIAQLFEQADPTEKWDWFVRSFAKTTYKSHPVTSRMKGVLSYFQRLSPRTCFDKYILKIIYFFKNSIETIKFYESGCLNKELLIQMREFLTVLSGVESKLNDYSQASCVVRDKHNAVPQNSKEEIERKLDKKIIFFVETVFSSIGFKYNPLSSTPVTVLNQ